MTEAEQTLNRHQYQRLNGSINANMDAGRTLWQGVASGFGEMTSPRTIGERLGECEGRFGDFGEIDRLASHTLALVLLLVLVECSQIGILCPLESLVEASKDF